jgi:hypothetical protein
MEAWTWKPFRFFFVCLFVEKKRGFAPDPAWITGREIIFDRVLLSFICPPARAGWQPQPGSPIRCQPAPEDPGHFLFASQIFKYPAAPADRLWIEERL